jgi:hypothetical protein
LGSELSNFRKSAGRSCATPPEIGLIICPAGVRL